MLKKKISKTKHFVLCFRELILPILFFYFYLQRKSAIALQTVINRLNGNFYSFIFFFSSTSRYPSAYERYPSVRVRVYGRPECSFKTRRRLPTTSVCARSQPSNTRSATIRNDDAVRTPTAEGCCAPTSESGPRATRLFTGVRV